MLWEVPGCGTLTDEAYGTLKPNEMIKYDARTCGSTDRRESWNVEKETHKKANTLTFLKA